MTDNETDGRILACEGRVRPEWIDINGHMNVAYYVLAFDLGVDALWARAGITEEYIATRNLSTFAVESHITFQAELKEDDPYRVTTQVLAVDDKRVHQFQCLYHAGEGYLAATAEWLNLHVDLGTRRVSPFPDEIRDAFIEVGKMQQGMAIPAEAGKRMLVTRPLVCASSYRQRFGLDTTTPDQTATA